jgi:hypothetical protein
MQEGPRKYGGIDIAGRDALAIFVGGQDQLLGYWVEAGADAGVPSDGERVTPFETWKGVVIRFIFSKTAYG